MLTAVLIDSLFVRFDSYGAVVALTVDGFCVDTAMIGTTFAATSEWKSSSNGCSAGTQYDLLCIDNEVDSVNACAPEQQIIDIDMSALAQSGMNVTESTAQWSDGRGAVPQIRCSGTMLPTSQPTTQPTTTPSDEPTTHTQAPTSVPTTMTSAPTTLPTNEPSLIPTSQPTHGPIANSGALITFGVELSALDLAKSDAAMTLSLWYERDIFECVVLPTLANATYECNSSAWTMVGTSCVKEYRLMVTVDNFDAVLVDVVFVETVDGGVYVDQFCVDTALISSGYRDTAEYRAQNNSCHGGREQFDVLCVDDEFGSGAKCGPKKQIVELARADWSGSGSDPSAPVEWSDGSEVSVKAETCAPTIEPTNGPTTEPTIDPTVDPTALIVESEDSDEDETNEAVSVPTVVNVLFCVFLLFA